MSGIVLFQRAQEFCIKGEVNHAFEHYQKSIKKIIKDENVTAPIRTVIPPDFPQELLGYVWCQFVVFFREMNFTEESAPDAFRLLKSFQPSATTSHPRLERTERGRVLLKGMQIITALTLGLLAWDKRDRATTAKRYQEGLDLAATHSPFTVLSPAADGLEKRVHKDLQQIETNLDELIQNDTINAQVLSRQGSDGAPARRDIANMPHTRVEASGGVTLNNTVMFATDACATCAVRGVKLRRCSRCKKTSYCGPECQNKDWSAHKTSCKQ